MYMDLLLHFAPISVLVVLICYFFKRFDVVGPVVVDAGLIHYITTEFWACITLPPPLSPEL